MAMGTDYYASYGAIDERRVREMRDYRQSQMRALSAIHEKARAEEAMQRAQEKAAAERETKLLLLLL